MGLDSGLNTGGLLQLLGFSSIILDLFPVLYHGLIAAAAQGHVDGGPGVLIVADIRIAVDADPDTQGNGHLISDINRLYILQETEPLRLQGRHIFLLDGKEIFVLFHLFYDAVDSGNIFADLPVNEGHQKRPAHLLHALQRFIIVIQINKTCHHFLVRDGLHIFMDLCLVIKVYGQHLLLRLLAWQQRKAGRCPTGSSHAL